MKIKKYLNKHYWWDLKYRISCFWNPRQQWLIDKIPDQYVELDELLETLMFEILVSFVETEKGLDSIYHDEMEEYYLEGVLHERITIRDELQEAYDYIKTERDILIKSRDNSYPDSKGMDHFVKEDDGMLRMKSCEEMWGKSYEEVYSELHRYEKLIEEKDTKTLQTIVNNRKWLWT